MNVRLLTRSTLVRPLKTLATSVRPFGCPRWHCLALTSNSLQSRAPCIYNRFRCVSFVNCGFVAAYIHIGLTLLTRTSWICQGRGQATTMLTSWSTINQKTPSSLTLPIRKSKAPILQVALWTPPTKISFRVAPVLKEQIDSGKINLTAIVNTHQ